MLSHLYSSRRFLQRGGYGAEKSVLKGWLNRNTGFEGTEETANTHVLALQLRVLGEGWDRASNVCKVRIRLGPNSAVQTVGTVVHTCHPSI